LFVLILYEHTTVPFVFLGSAVGFRLDSLLKLSDTRARNNKMTLMHYLSKVPLYSPFVISIFETHVSLHGVYIYGICSRNKIPTA
jgi:hypothetical protein